MKVRQAAAQFVKAQRWVIRVQLKQLECLPILIPKLRVLPEEPYRTARVALREDEFIFRLR